MTESAELKPCPFCGHAEIDPCEWMDDKGNQGPGCPECGALADSVTEWNRRAPAKRGEWVSVTDRMPDAGRTVLAFYLNSLGKPRRIRAVYIDEKTREAGPEEFQDGGAVYDETRDTYYWPAGWYERIDNWDDYSHVAVIEGEVTYWMEIPAGPVVDAAISKDEAK